jgi:hypothetical protein
MIKSAVFSNPIYIYDIDSASEIKDLLKINPSMADKNITAKVNMFSRDDLVFVTKKIDGGLKIIDIKKVDIEFISSYLK